MMEYFIHRQASDGIPNSDFKDINSKAFPLFKAGHVQSVLHKEIDNNILLECKCFPEMKKTTTYGVRVALDRSSNDIVFAKCGCPAGRGPTCCCKHLGAFCYFLEEFCRTHKIREQTTSTSSIQQWHQPRKRTTKEPCSIENIKFIKAEYGKIKKVISTNYDPRPNLLCKTTEDEVQKFRSELELLQTPIAFLDVLPENTYLVKYIDTLPPTPRSSQARVQAAIQKNEQPISLSELSANGKDFLQRITLSKADIKQIEMATRKQTLCARWHEERYCHITSSVFGMLCKGRITSSKLQSVLYNSSQKMLSTCNSAILWGRLHESTAFEKYKENLDHQYLVNQSGIHISQHGFLAASPEGVVLNKENATICGTIEIKCPYSCRNISVCEACTNKSFFCEIENNDICLKRSHYYYYQVQGAMAILKVSWCDFIVWTTKDMTVERILFDQSFWSSCFTNLRNIYISSLLPEIIYPRHHLSLDILQYVRRHRKRVL